MQPVVRSGAEQSRAQRADMDVEKRRWLRQLEWSRGCCMFMVILQVVYEYKCEKNADFFANGVIVEACGCSDE